MQRQTSPQLCDRISVSHETVCLLLLHTLKNHNLQALPDLVWGCGVKQTQTSSHSEYRDICSQCSLTALWIFRALVMFFIYSRKQTAIKLKESLWVAGVWSAETSLMKAPNPMLQQRCTLDVLTSIKHQRNSCSRLLWTLPSLNCLPSLKQSRKGESLHQIVQSLQPS